MRINEEFQKNIFDNPSILENFVWNLYNWIFIYIIWYDNINLGEREVEEKYSIFLDWLIEDIEQKEFIYFFLNKKIEYLLNLLAYNVKL
jgi:hypothetical protein